MILAVDIGTSKLKGGVFNRQGKQLAGAQAPLSLRVQPRLEQDAALATGSAGTTTGFEIEAAQWIEALKQVCRQLDLARFPELTSLVISGNGPTLLPVDAAGNPLYPAITWLDTRGREETAGRLKEQGVAFKQPSFFLAKAFWLKQHRPALYAKTRYFISCPEYINFYLCGEIRTVLPSPAFTDYYWTNAALLALGLEPDKFPPFTGPGKLLGTLRETAAAELGIPSTRGKKQLTIVTGGPDYLMALLGTGTIRAGLTCDRAGTSEGINHCATHPAAGQELLSLPHLIDGLFTVSGSLSTSGKALDWFREISGYGSTSYEQFFAEIAAVEPGARKLFFLPHLAGERAPLWNPQACGAFIGLALHHTRQEMGRAVVESLGYGIHQIVARLAAGGFQVTELRLSGQQARNRLYNQLKADITGLPLLVPVCTDAELVGDACLGLTANGIYRSIEAAVTACVKIGSVIEPNPAYRSFYTEMAALYTRAYLSLKPIVNELNALA